MKRQQVPSKAPSNFSTVRYMTQIEMATSSVSVPIERQRPVRMLHGGNRIDRGQPCEKRWLPFKSISRLAKQPNIASFVSWPPPLCRTKACMCSLMLECSASAYCKAASTNIGAPISGTGLGLAIVRHIASMHGWEAGYTPRSGAGAVFWLDGVYG